VLTVVDLSKVKHLRSLIRTWNLKNITATDFTLNCPGAKRLGLYYRHFGTTLPLDIQGFVAKVINDEWLSIRFELCGETIRVEKR
jgi:hypothetical protein